MPGNSTYRIAVLAPTMEAGEAFVATMRRSSQSTSTVTVFAEPFPDFLDQEEYDLVIPVGVEMPPMPEASRHG